VSVFIKPAHSSNSLPKDFFLAEVPENLYISRTHRAIGPAIGLDKAEIGTIFAHVARRLAVTRGVEQL
jgi:hypothetical protein